MKKRLLSVFMLLLILCATLTGVVSCAKKGSEAASEARNGVVRVWSIYSDGSESMGSAFGIGEAGKETDTFVTNHHVVNEYIYDENGYVTSYGDPIAVYILFNDEAFDPLLGLDQSQMIPCEVIYESSTGYPDMAIIKASKPIEGRVALPLLKDMDDLKVGDDVYTLGFPGTSDTDDNKLIASVESMTVTKGIVSRIYKDSNYGNTQLIQHTSQINHGNSGGPLINEKGQVVGINTYGHILSADDILSGDTTHWMSVTIDQVIKVLDDLDIEYDTGSNIWTVIAIIAGVLLIAAVVVIVLLVLKKKETAPYVAPAAPSAPIYTSSAPRLQCVEGIFKGKRFFIEGEVRIGRDPAKNNLLYPADAEGISGVHCLLRAENGTVILQDLGSTYGTFLGDGRRLSAGETAVLNIGDRFWLGSEKEHYVIAPKGGI